MSFAADTGKESDFLRNCTMNGCVTASLIVFHFLISLVLVNKRKELVLWYSYSFLLSSLCRKYCTLMMKKPGLSPVNPEVRFITDL